jgi:8-oxo-dGTP diphosphatase
MGDRLDVALALPVRGGRVLVTRRAEGLHLAGYWEFPGGKVEAGEEPAAAARRELEEETGLVARELVSLSIFVHEYTDRPIRFHVFIARDPEGQIRIDGAVEWAWKRLAELRGLRMPPANAQMIGALSWRIGE